MFFRSARRLFARHSALQAASHQPPKPQAKPAATGRRIPAWEQVLTFSLKENALAPADEVVLHAFDLYCDELSAPFDERRRLLNARFSRIAAGFARVQSLAPDMVERAAAKHRLEVDRFIDKVRIL